MSLFAVLVLAAVLMELLIGIRLVALSLRTGGLPERLWGVAWILDATSQGGAELTRLVVDTPAFVPLNAFTAALGSGAIVSLLAGIWLVFRAEVHWMRWFVAALAFALGAVFVALLFQGQVAKFPGQPAPAMTWVNRVTAAGLLLYGGVETTLAYRASERRLRLGLSTRLESTRFLLWGIAAFCLFAFLALLMARDLLGVPSTVVRLAQPALALGSVLSMWLTFFPPDWMRKRLAV
ncbi:MAG: hypothetical protein AAF654_00290 [Myxococcota bacterium]